MLVLLNGISQAGQPSKDCRETAVDSANEGKEENMKRSFETYFKSEKSLDSMRSLLNARIPIFWIQTRGNDFDPPHVEGIEEDKYTLFIEPIKNHPGFFSLTLFYFPGVNPADYEWDRHRQIVLDTLGVQEVPAP